MRMWRNWQTRRFQVPVGNSVWVQIPSFAPNKSYQLDTTFFIHYGVMVYHQPRVTSKKEEKHDCI